MQFILKSNYFSVIETGGYLIQTLLHDNGAKSIIFERYIR